jgi:hypothetical protein
VSRDLSRETIEDAADDPDGQALREHTCRGLAGTFREAGKLLWVIGYFVGADRVEGASPFGFGSDKSVGLALVIQIGGELLDGAVTLLSDDNLYGAASLLRQLVEIEYLAWAFAEDDEQAMEWTERGCTPSDVATAPVTRALVRSVPHERLSRSLRAWRASDAGSDAATT